MRTLRIDRESWPLQHVFRISDAEKTAADLVVATIREEEYTGRGECAPFPRYGSTSDSVTLELESWRQQIEARITRDELRLTMPPGPTRAAIDCALWDLEARREGVDISQVLGLPRPEKSYPTAGTVSMDRPSVMAAAAKALPGSVIKIKLGGADAEDSIRAVRTARPDASLIIDVNGGWTVADLTRYAPAIAEARIALVEQPVAPGRDGDLEGLDLPFTICADESVQGLADIGRLAPLYDAVNIKIDKAGGLTEAALMVAEARESGLKIMIGCMVATSLSMAPAFLLAPVADFLDLDGPVWLEADREGGFSYSDGRIAAPDRPLWGRR